ncbi:hypothetical protein BJX64DRAFT_283965 [Aspergillus heterothallicus]
MCTFYTVRYLCNCIYDEWVLPCYFTRGPSNLLRQPNPSKPDSASQTQHQSQSNSPPQSPQCSYASSSPSPPSKTLPKSTQNQPCYHTRIIETYDVLTLCEVCFSHLDTQIRQHGVKAVLASPERFPLAEKLGMLIVIENDALEQWRVFRKGEQCFFLQREVGVQSLGGEGGGKVQVPSWGRGRSVVGGDTSNRSSQRGKRVRGPDADVVWKVESSPVYRLGFTIYEQGRLWEEEGSESESGRGSGSDETLEGRGERPRREGVWQGTYYEERPLGHHPRPDGCFDI